jgi:hypothetical protein
VYVAQTLVRRRDDVLDQRPEMRRYDRTPLLVANVAEMDFVEHSAHFRALVQHIVAPSDERLRHVHPQSS